jgi:hypothetical protein
MGQISHNICIMYHACVHAFTPLVVFLLSCETIFGLPTLAALNLSWFKVIPLLLGIYASVNAHPNGVTELIPMTARFKVLPVFGRWNTSIEGLESRSSHGSMSPFFCVRIVDPLFKSPNKSLIMAKVKEVNSDLIQARN